MTTDSPIFELVCDELEKATTLSKLEARGTVRLALKEAGLEAASVTGGEMSVVVEKILPEELAARGVRKPDLAARLRRALERAGDDGPGTATAADIFRHLGGDR